MYQIDYRRSAEKDIRKLSSTVRAQAVRKILALAETPSPSGATRLRTADKLHKVRIGNYRIVYEIHDTDKQIVIVAVKHRSEVYKNL